MKIIVQVTRFVINVLDLWSHSYRKRYGWYRLQMGVREESHIKTVRTVSTKKRLFFFYKRSKEKEPTDKLISS